MAIAVRSWLGEHIGVYVKNAAAVRDYRVQLRGNRAILLWAVYLVVLIGFGMITYSSAATGDQVSVVLAQQSLHSFYGQIMALLATAIGLIAPALTATSIVAERQRRSLDLVFSAPVTPKYYLVGKMISSYRYVWMLLVLSLPVTAACVVLGGATWSEVLVCYGLLSLHGLIFTSIALLFSTLAQKPVGAIIWSYVGVLAYNIIAAYASFVVLETRSFGPTPMLGSFNEISFVASWSPYAVMESASTYMVLFGYHVPNWVTMVAFTLLFVKLMLVGAGSVLSPYGSRETKSLRVHGILYLYVSALLLAVGVASTIHTVTAVTGSMGTTTTPTYDPALYFGRLFLSVTLWLVIVLPFLTCYGTDLEKKFWPDGLFRVRRILLGTPSGGLPYLVLLMLAAAAGIATLAVWMPSFLDLRYGFYVFYGLAFMFFCWSIGRLTSAMHNGLRYARTMQFAIILLIIGLPLPFLAIADADGFTGRDYGVGTPVSSSFTLWDLYILRPLFSTDDRSLHALILGIVLLLAGYVIVRCSEPLAKSRYGRIGLSYGSTQGIA